MRQVQEHLLTIDQIQDLGRQYQAIMRLSDWNITYRMLPHRDMLNLDGRCHYWTEHRRAKIDLIDPKERETQCDPYDMEQTLVHELMHVSHSMIDSISDGSGKDRARINTDLLEQHIDSIAWAIVDARRGLIMDVGKTESN